MACGACWQQRQVLYGAVRQGNPYAMMRAVTRGAAIAADKFRGVDVNQKYAVQQMARPVVQRRRLGA